MTRDEELMTAYVSGDSRAFGQLFDRYAPMLMRIMKRRVRGDGDAEELVQQTCLQLHRARNDFDASRAFRPWLMTIAFNLQRELFRRRQRRPEAPLEFEPAAPSSERAPLERSERAAQLRAAVASIPSGQREVIELHWFEELSFAEVAQVLGLGLSAVKVRAHRGYKALREHLERAREVEAVTELPIRERDRTRGGNQP
ncbi:MAG: sigma-70 family RNA polymerase sigma factor [Myxococcales bacterium]|nr:sigma-70 family RNA polymerase sigma factor [Myxococcales bacterium]